MPVLVAEETDTAPARIVCILAMPRTGSSHLIHLLRACPQLNVKSELFKAPLRLPPADRDAVRAASGATADGNALTKWRRGHPARVLDVLFEAGGGRPLFFKLFPKHLTRELIANELFSRNDVRYIVLRRRVIDSFISNSKAQYFGVHKDVDTTGWKPAIEAEEFVTWASKASRWYDWLAQELHARRLAFLDLIYETHFKNAENLAALAAVLDGLAAMGLAKIDLPEEIDSTERQDREPDYRARVANWTEFEQEIAAVPQHAELLRWAEAVPVPLIPRQTGMAANNPKKADEHSARRLERRRSKRDERHARKRAPGIDGHDVAEGVVK